MGVDADRAQRRGIVYCDDTRIGVGSETHPHADQQMIERAGKTTESGPRETRGCRNARI